MPITTEMLPSEPIIVATFNEPFNVAADMTALLADIKRLRETAARAVIVVLDVSQVALDFELVTDALARARSQILDGQAAGDQLPSQYVFVGSTALVEIAAQAMAQKQYGGIGGQVFASVEAALAHARTLIDAGA